MKKAWQMIGRQTWNTVQNPGVTGVHIWVRPGSVCKNSLSSGEVWQITKVSTVGAKRSVWAFTGAWGMEHDSIHSIRSWRWLRKRGSFELGLEGWIGVTGGTKGRRRLSRSYSVSKHRHKTHHEDPYIFIFTLVFSKKCGLCCCCWQETATRLSRFVFWGRWWWWQTAGRGGAGKGGGGWCTDENRAGSGLEVLVQESSSYNGGKGCFLWKRICIRIHSVWLRVNCTYL